METVSDMRAERPDAAVRVWVLTDGKAGDEMPLVGVAEALGHPFELRRVRPRAPWTWLMPYGPIDPRERPSAQGSPLAPPFPDICLATGRRAIAYARHVKRASGCLTVLFKNPRVKAGFADLVFVQEHDSLRGERVVVTLTGPNRITAERLAAARADPIAAVRALPPPRAAVLVGGDTRRFRYGDGDIERLVAGLRDTQAAGVSLMITISRRTPPALRAALKALAERPGTMLWEGEGANPYIDFLGNADHVIVTADSTNMVGEAAATGRPVHVFHPARQGSRFDSLIDGLRARGIAHSYPGPLDGAQYEPLNETRAIAKAILQACRARGKG